MVNHLEMKLGAKLSPPDPRTLKLADYLDIAALPPVPAEVDYSTKVAQWPMFLNNQLGDCVPAAMAHQEQAAGAANGAEPAITDADVLATYEAIGGYVPGEPATDQGCDPSLALKYWQKTGLAGNTIGAYVSVDPTNAALVQAALYLFGGLFIGLGLPIAAQNQSPWDVVGDGKTGNSAPYSWGGHMVYGVAHDASGLYRVVTWGELQPMTQAFLATYSDQQTFAVIPADWLNGQQQAPNGFDIAALQRDLAIVSGQPDPGPQPEPTPTPTPERDGPPPVIPDGFDATLPFDEWLGQHAPTLFSTLAAALSSDKAAVLLTWQTRFAQLTSATQWQESLGFWAWIDVQPETAGVLTALAAGDPSGNIANWISWMEGKGYLTKAAA